MRTMFADRQVVATREFIFSARSPHERRLFVVRFLRLSLSFSSCPLSAFIQPSVFFGFEYLTRRRRIGTLFKMNGNLKWCKKTSVPFFFFFFFNRYKTYSRRKRIGYIIYILRSLFEFVPLHSIDDSYPTLPSRLIGIFVNELSFSARKTLLEIVSRIPIFFPPVLELFVEVSENDFTAA